jgi:hypothetical protein
MPAFRPSGPVRPGDVRHPLPEAAPAELFARASADRGIALAAAVELALERALVADELRQCTDGAYERLLARAAREPFARPLLGPYRRYFDALRHPVAEPFDIAALQRPVSVPLRLFPQVLDLDPPTALTPTLLHEAVTLELGALRANRTMTEYALHFAATRR